MTWLARPPAFSSLRGSSSAGNGFAASSPANGVMGGYGAQHPPGGVPSEADLCMLQLAHLQLQAQAQQAQQAQPSPFAGLSDQPWAALHRGTPVPDQAPLMPRVGSGAEFAGGVPAGFQVAGNAPGGYAPAQGGGDMHHVASAPASLFQQEVLHLRKMGLLDQAALQVCAPSRLLLASIALQRRS